MGQKVHPAASAMLPHIPCSPSFLLPISQPCPHQPALLYMECSGSLQAAREQRALPHNHLAQPRTSDACPGDPGRCCMTEHSRKQRRPPSSTEIILPIKPQLVPVSRWCLHDVVRFWCLLHCPSSSVCQYGEKQATSWN